LYFYELMGLIGIHIGFIWDSEFFKSHFLFKRTVYGLNLFNFTLEGTIENDDFMEVVNL
jgi:hypothetical protein